MNFLQNFKQEVENTGFLICSSFSSPHQQSINQGNAANSSETSMATQAGGSVTSRAASETRSGGHAGSSGAGNTGGNTQTGAKFRHGLLQLMIHTIDPLHDGELETHTTTLLIVYFVCILWITYSNISV